MEFSLDKNLFKNLAVRTCIW